MEKITKKQFYNLEFAGQRNTASKLNRALASLKINEALIIKKEEWDLKTTPVVRIATDQSNKKSFLHKRGIKVIGRTLANDFGWAILRIL